MHTSFAEHRNQSPHRSDQGQGHTGQTSEMAHRDLVTLTEAAEEALSVSGEGGGGCTTAVPSWMVGI